VQVCESVTVCVLGEPVGFVALKIACRFHCRLPAGALMCGLSQSQNADVCGARALRVLCGSRFGATISSR
jgi:hypothetical protein